MGGLDWATSGRGRCVRSPGAGVAAGRAGGCYGCVRGFDQAGQEPECGARGPQSEGPGGFGGLAGYLVVRARVRLSGE